MRQYSLLVLTDHAGHSEHNSIYSLLLEMRKNKRCKQIDVASRSLKANDLFFEKMAVRSLFAAPVTQNFSFDAGGKHFTQHLRQVRPYAYDAILLRLPHPVSDAFWSFLETAFPKMLFINQPSGMRKIGNKAFMLQFPQLCPPMKLCQSLEEIDAARQQYPIVLKPLFSYGGKGILQIRGEEVLRSEGGKMSFQEFAQAYEADPIPYLAVKFLENVDRGDKRLVVCCGEVLGAALRLPAAGSWVCNIAQGGSSTPATPDDDELAIIATIDPVLKKNGVVFYGIDTLVDDDGRRKLSEINALSIGGLYAMQNEHGIPAAKRAADLLWNYIHEMHHGEG